MLNASETTVFVELIKVSGCNSVSVSIGCAGWVGGGH